MCISAIIILVFFIPYTASGFKAIGTLFSSLFGTDYHIAMIVGAVVIVGYTVMGGFMAVSTTDPVSYTHLYPVSINRNKSLNSQLCACCLSVTYRYLTAKDNKSC